MSEKSDQVDAIFGGEDRVFCIQREDLRAFELAVGMPAYQMFTRFAGGFWTLRDLRAVLVFALASKEADPALDLIRSFAAVTDEGGGVDRVNAEHLGRLASAPIVADVLTSNPPAPYAMLALKVIEAAQETMTKAANNAAGVGGHLDISI